MTAAVAVVQIALNGMFPFNWVFCLLCCCCLGFLFVYGFASQSPGMQLCNPGLIADCCEIERIFCM